MSAILKLFKRHTPLCPDRSKGRYFIGCDCAFWYANPFGDRLSLGTNSLTDVLSQLRDDRPEADHRMRYAALDLARAFPPGDGQFVYVVKPEYGDVVKIGVAADVEQRLTALQVSHAECLAVVRMLHGGIEHERQLHELFKDYRRKGEWFQFCGPIAKWIVETEMYDARGLRGVRNA